MNCAVVFLRYSNSLEVEIKDTPVIRRYISLPFMAKGHSRENVGTVLRCVDSSQKNVRDATGSCMVVTIMVTVRAIPTMVPQVRSVISVA